MKKVDVIICAYNAHKYIEIALDSVAKQTIKDKILVTIVNDGSTKGYQDIADKYQEKLDIQIINLKRNHGLGYAKQVGLEKTHNEYFTFLDSDDSFKNANSIEALLKEMTKNPNFKLVCGRIDMNGKIQHSEIFIHGKLFKRSHIQKYNIKNKNLYIYEDFCFLNAYECLLENNEKKKINDIIYCYNQGLDNNSITSTKKDSIKILKCLIYSYDYGVKLAKKYKKNIYDKKKAATVFYIMYKVWKNPFKNIEEKTLYQKYCYKFYKKYHQYIDYYINDADEWFYEFIKVLNTQIGS